MIRLKNIVESLSTTTTEDSLRKIYDILYCAKVIPKRVNDYKISSIAKSIDSGDLSYLDDIEEFSKLVDSTTYHKIDNLISEISND